MSKDMCKDCGYIGYPTYIHNDDHCSNCYSKHLVAPLKRVRVKSMLGLLGHLEDQVCYLHDTDYDINTNTKYAVVSVTLNGHKDRIAIEHIAEYVDDEGNPVKEYPKVESKPKTKSDDFESKLKVILSELENLLVSKNKKYGNSALEPVRVFSKASPTEQLLVRLDDKLSRLKTQHIDEDEDVLTDLIGYLLLLKMSMKG